MDINQPVTLESRLRECAEQNERADSLLRSYQAVKDDMKLYLPAIFSYYPHYSAHDSSHSQSLVSAIELILGEPRIRELSPADIWLVLVAAQLHDIGMILPNEEIIELAGRQDFKKYLEGMRSAPDSDFAKAADLLLDKKIQEGDNAWFLDIKQSVILLVAEYLRRQHAERSGVAIAGETAVSRLLSRKQNGGLARAYMTVGSICAMHGRGFDDLFALYETDSILHMECHPRFAAALIRLGDLCDVDNGRFNDAIIAVFGRLPQSSLVHFYKHKTITRLRISAREICMSADIPFEKIQKELTREGYAHAVKGEDFCHRIVREHQRWFQMIQEELKNLLLHAGEIFPEHMDQTLPAFRQEILVGGRRSVLADSNLRLNFAPEKAYALIEGYSLYDEQRTFVREFVQNSLDAMKIQLWRDLKDGRWNPYLPREKRAGLSELQPFDLCKEIYEAYRVEIRTETDETAHSKTITFQDSGIGISYDDLQNNIIRTGASWDTREKYESELSEMPPWLRPTGGFGIGLHAAFAVTDRIEIRSMTRYEESPKHIIIHSGQQDGFVFARTVEEPFFHGTVITVEIEKPMSEIRSERSEISPYDVQPEDEFAFFIEEYLEKIISCPLFPVYLNEKQIGDMLCTSARYGAVFGEDRREETDGDVALAVTDDSPMRYIVWDRRAGNFYRLVPSDGSGSYARCSFKGIYLEECSNISVYYDEWMELEELECLCTDSKKAVSADRKGFLEEYKRSIWGRMRHFFKPLLCYGEEQFNELLKAPSGSLATDQFLQLCDEIARFSAGEDDSLSQARKERLDAFAEAMAEEAAEKKAVYILYVAFAHLRFFIESINRFMQEKPDLVFKQGKESDEELMQLLQPQFRLMTDTFAYLYEQSDYEIRKAFGSDFGEAFGRAFLNGFGSEFGRAFLSGFGRAFLSRFGSEFESEFERAFLSGFESEFGTAFLSGFGSEFKIGFETGAISKFRIESLNKSDRLFLNLREKHILANGWAWLVGIGYCEKTIPKCADSVYFRSIPALHFPYFLEGVNTVFDLLAESELCVLYKNLPDMRVRLPFSRHLTVKELRLDKEKLLCFLTVEDGAGKTIDCSGDGALAAYFRELKQDQRSIFCPASYRNLGMEVQDLPNLYKLGYVHEAFFPGNLYIVLPRTVEDTDFFDFLTLNRGKHIDELADAVMQAEDTVNIIKYTYLHRQDKKVTLEEIRAQYRSFLLDFSAARLEGGGDVPSAGEDAPQP